LNRFEEKILNTKLMVLIVSPPGDLQIGLQALLTTHLDVDVLAVGDGSSALKVIERHNPAMVILDQDIRGSTVTTLIHHIKTIWPEIIRIVLVNDDQARPKIIDAGSDLIVIKGLPGAKLIEKIKTILITHNKEKGNERPESTSREIR
jgi:DNA-binding NarL/FixJ family response regulator